MKWIAVFICFVGDAKLPVHLEQAENPGPFSSYEECETHIRRVMPAMNKIIVAAAPNLDTALIGECREQDDL